MLGLEDPILHADVGFQYLKNTLVFLCSIISLPYTQDIRDIITFVRHDAADGYNFNVCLQLFAAGQK